METQTAYATPLKPAAKRARKTAKPEPIPEGYMSLDEFSMLLHHKLDEAYAKLHGNSEQ